MLALKGANVVLACRSPQKAEAAAERIRAEKPDGTARAAGMSRQGLYLHFPTKDVLFEAAVLHFVAGIREAAQAALSREDLRTEERILTMFGGHGHSIGQLGTEHMNELLEAAAQRVGPVVRELEEGLVGDLSRVLRSGGVAARWKDRGVTATELADHLYSTSSGLKHRVSTPEAYGEAMRVAVQIVCGGPA